MSGKLSSLLIVVTSVSLVSTQSPVSNYDIFVPYENLVQLGVRNITPVSAVLQWILPQETRNLLQAMRVNCTTLKSLVEPYDTKSPPITLYNPSILGTHITIFDLYPATKYSCRLVGALSLEIGKEKLAILSEPVVFTTPLEKDDSKTYELSYGVNPLRIILGIVLPLVIIIIATILIIVGYHQYKRSRKKAGRSENNKKNRKFRLHLKKRKGSPSPKPPPSSPSPSLLPPETGHPHSSKRDRKASERSERSDRSKKDKGKRSSKDTSKQTNAKKGGKSSAAEKLVASGGSEKGKTKKPWKKKKSKENYVYSELKAASSEEEDLFGYQLGEPEHQEYTADDLRWDPLAYYPTPETIHGKPDPIPSKHIGLKDISSPAIMVRSHDEVDSPTTYTDGKYYQSHLVQPQY